MSIKRTIELTCDACGTQSKSSYSWAQIHIHGSTETMTLGPDQHYEVCSECWKKIHKLMREIKLI